MNEHIVYSPNEIARIPFFIFLRFYWTQPVEKSDLAQDNWVFCLQ